MKQLIYKYVEKSGLYAYRITEFELEKVVSTKEFPNMKKLPDTIPFDEVIGLREKENFICVIESRPKIIHTILSDKTFTGWCK